MQLALADVIVPEGRFRDIHPDAVQGLMDSIIKFGLLQPIIVETSADGIVLIDGLHRLTATQHLAQEGTHPPFIEAIERSDLTELMKREIELEANMMRTEVTWQEKARALVELDRLKREQNPNWTLSQTAEVAGIEKTRISEAAKVVQMMEIFPEIGESKNMAQATRRAYEKAKSVQRVMDVNNKVIDYSHIENKIILGDSVDVIRTIPDESFHAIITDPPFGVDYEDRVAGTIGEMSSYVDDHSSYLRILSMASDMYRVLKPDGWLVFFCGISWYEEVKSKFRHAGFTVDEIPIIWDRSSGRTFTSRPDRWFTRGYDIAIHALKGNPTLAKRSTCNIISIDPVPTSERELLVERPVELYAELIQRLTIPGEKVADFFVGSGSCPAAAALTGRDYFGVELDPARRAWALSKIQNYTPSK
ncbi:AdoMet_MTases domain containing protein [uncultured Caudovirales phage]|uniref:AdoMet_MTases domain containing protein n=2 Tax=root TaxID=1 RepID=A0A6J5QH02_9CAUD|nr:AdoMet_MTases domain containing protein [uncultured Caudovirales phage]CAB4171275.1 AdoMet_MTases domain containing protein [uncultured Caudovirales phage]CAB4177233.1 AdoMet_MTases domain containing protein [uncultured Caudovirales phage]CAB4182892.1 AdoMet_MTases domain containing protein [uncultured Caudovirales phage]CAB4187545.1 AdoMet_MTases domain containing protein [uncultured Caudovirales phage]